MDFNLAIPVFCDYYEPFLVEEIALMEHPTMLHYGKCAVIGYLKQGSTMLDSLMIPGLPSDLQLPDGTCQLELFLDNYPGPLHYNSTIRVYGSVRLRGPPDSSMSNSKDLIFFFRQLRTENERKETETTSLEFSFQKEWDLAVNIYKPALEVEWCEILPQAKEIAACNLRLKRINKILGPVIQELKTQNF
ncbi:uncharacterized protein LOC128739740 [Sabethes cyaneus]|uniref:uncharacterized protein LOC128739740 n=1 Tax=Sabethes cyaneus TaxID=53552 RepID=UPI00237DE65E|nr:uncharacterized protein LOC128739740 [Sabethes cyaneus]